MATEVIERSGRERRAASTVDGGTALTTTAVVVPLLAGTSEVTLLPRNFSLSTSVWKWAKTPYLKILKTTDLLAAVANTTNYSAQAQDGDTATVVTLSSLSTLANKDAVFVGSHLPFRGVAIDVSAANGDASVLLVEYWNGSAWVTASATDGTTSGGATMAIDGQVTWTVPSDWATALLANTTGGSSLPIAREDGPIYWTRWSFSVALDAATTLSSMLALHRSTAYQEMLQTTGHVEECRVGPGGFGGIEALTSAGTANLIVNCATSANGSF